MAKRNPYLWPAVTAVIGILVLLLALPPKYRSWAPGILANPDFHLGLDLAGGTQLDFRISEDELKEEIASIDAEIAALENGNGSPERLSELRLQKQVIQEQGKNLVEAIRTVLERRINSLGVSEATITPSYVGDEKHLLVECPGVVDVQKCIDTVGKTIQLEFKEEQTEATAEFEGTVRKSVDDAQKRITQSGTTLETLGQDLGDELGNGYQEAHTYFRDELPKGLEALWNLTPEQGIKRIEGSVPSTQQNAAGQMETIQVPGIFLAQVTHAKTQTGRILQEASTAFDTLQKTEPILTYRFNKDYPLGTGVPARVISTLKAMQPGDLKVAAMEDGSAKIFFVRNYVPGREEVDVSHILVAYKGATEAPATVTRTKEEALARAKALKQQLAGGANFEALARTESDGPSKQNAGLLGPITRQSLVPSFEQAAFSQPVNVVGDPVETPFGYHLIRVNKAAGVTPDVASFDSLTVSGSGAETRANTLLARLQNGDVTKQEEAIGVSFLFFSLKPTGWKDTELDGTHFRAAGVSLDPTTNIPVVQIAFDDEGGQLFRELTKRNIGKRIAIFVGGQLVSAPTVQTEIAGGTAVITGSQNVQEARTLAQDLNTGAIPAPIHLSGQRTVEATLGADSLRSSINAALLGIAILMVFMIAVYRFLGVLADLALLIYALIFLAILKLPLFFVTNQYIVLTLAGAAGMILSIGMAVDTNVLVFERVKEEMKKGKSLKTAVETGFQKAWPSIRDSNISTLITCAVLFFVGTSIVRGFAVTLGMGVIISMLTGMIITRAIARYVAGTKLAERTALFIGGKRS